MATDDIHETAITRFNNIYSVQLVEREIAVSDRRFTSIEGAQWEGDFGEQFKNRVRIEANMVALAVNRVVNEYRANRITVDFTSKNGTTGDPLADVCDGLYRADEQYSGAVDAYDVAFQEGATGGYGAWRYIAAYEDEYDSENDKQRILVEPITDADSNVFFDLNAKKQDKSDAKYAYVISTIDRMSYEDEYDDDVSSWPDTVLSYWWDAADTDVVRIAEYYQVTDESATVYTYRHVDGSEEKITEVQFEAIDGLKADLKAKGSKRIRTRKVKRRVVDRYLLSGSKVLSGPERIAGPNIPVVPYYGRRVMVDNLERVRGVVRSGKDLNRLMNVGISRVAQQSASNPDVKPIFAPEQMDDPSIRNAWANANVENPAYLLAAPLADQHGNIVSAGPVGHTQPAILDQATATILSTVGANLDAVLGNQQAGEQVSANTSGKAILAVQDRVDMQAYEFMDNMSKSMKRGGEIWLGMAKEVYVEDGRAMKTIGPKKEIGTVTLGAKTLLNGTVVSETDLSRADFDVNVEVGPSSASKRDALVSKLMEAAGIVADPETQIVLTSLVLQNIEGEGMGDVQEWIRKKMVGMGVSKPTEEDLREQEQAAQGQEPSPQDQFLATESQKNEAQAQKLVADTEQSQAKTRNIEADTQATISEIDREDQKLVLDTVSELGKAQLERQPVQPQIRTSNGNPPGQ